MIAVLAGNRRQFDDFIKYWVAHEDQAKFHCVTRETAIYGRKFTEVIRIGTYYELRHHEELYYLLQQRVMLDNNRLK